LTAESVFAEEQFVYAAENFFDADGCGEEAVAAQTSAGNHLAFGTQIAEREDRRVFQRGIAVDRALDAHLALASSVHQDEIGLEPTGGVQGQLIVVLFPNDAAIVGLAGHEPTLVVAGARDPATPPEHSRIIASKIPGARIVELDAAHLSNIEARDGFTTSVLEFLAA